METAEHEYFLRAGLVLAVGLLIGFQRESSGHNSAGIRTFPLIALSGFFVSLVANSFGGWVFAAGLLSLSSIFVLGYWKNQKEQGHHGITTETAGMVLFLLSAQIAQGKYLALSVVSAGVMALLLFLKKPLHGAIAHMDSPVIRAIMQFVLIAFVVFPLLPDESYDPYGVLNPREIWFVVVLITGISLGSYALQKTLSRRSGVLMTGVLGGLISSTAATVSYAKRVEAGKGVGVVALVILLASTTAFLRMLVEIFAVAPDSFRNLAGPLVFMFAVMVFVSLMAFFATKDKSEALPATANPAEVKAAVLFGLLYALILFGSAAVKDEFGTGGLYIVSLVTGLADVDAITISTASLVQKGRLEASEGWRLMLVASLSNLFFKGIVASLLGGAALARRLLLYFGIPLTAGVAILCFW